MKLSSSRQLTSKGKVFSQKGGDAHPSACCENTGRKVFCNMSRWAEEIEEVIVRYV